MICFKKKTQTFTYLCAALLFALLGSFFFCRSSVYADSINYSFSQVYAPTYKWSLNNGNSYSWSVGPTPVASYTNWQQVMNQSSYGLEMLNGRVQAPAPIQALSFQVNFNITIYTWGVENRAYLDFQRNCDGLYALIHPLNGQTTTPLDADYESVVVSSCGADSTSGQMNIQVSALFQFDDLTNVQWWHWELANPAPNTSVPGNGWIFSCGNFAPSIHTCQSNWWWGLQTFDFSIEYTVNKTEALLQQQLAIQREEWQQNQQDRQDYTDLDGEGQDEGNDAGSQATNVGNSLLSVFSNFITAVYNIHTTNCMLPDLSYNGVVLRNMNLCTLSIPAPLSAIGSIGLVFILVPLAIHIVNRMINMYKEIFGQ